MTRLLVLVALLCSCVPAPTAPAGDVACTDVVSSGEPRADVAALAERCAPRFSRVRGEASGVQGEGDPSARLALEVRGERRCFRVIAAGDAGVAELDVQVIDPAGRVLARDARHGRLAVVPEDGALCLPAGGRYTVEIAVTAGAGAFVAQAFASR